MSKCPNNEDSRLLCRKLSWGVYQSLSSVIRSSRSQEMSLCVVASRLTIMADMASAGILSILDVNSCTLRDPQDLRAF